MLQELSRSFSNKSIRELAIVRLLVDLGLRRGEVVGLDLADLDLDLGSIWVVGKGREEKQKLGLPEPTQEVLRKWVRVRGVEPGPLFLNMDKAGKGQRLSGTSIYRLTRRLGRRAGLREIGWHDCRHTFASHLVMKGVPLKAVQELLGHATVEMTMRYSHLAPVVKQEAVGVLDDATSWQQFGNGPQKEDRAMNAILPTQRNLAGFSGSRTVSPTGVEPVSPA